MGSCISKCKPKSSPKELNLVQDKLVITQQTPTKDPPTISPSKKSSTCSVSNNSSAFSKSPLSSSCSVSTDSSAFTKSPLSSTCSSSTSNSNEFVWTYGKENLHPSVPVKSVSPAPEKSVPVQNQPKYVNSSTPKKRSRSNSPVLTRQKSFRRETEAPHQITVPLSRRNLGSSSPSRILHSRIPETEKFHGYTAVPKRNIAASSPSRRFGSDVLGINRKNYLISSSPSRRFGTDISETRRNLSSPSPSRRFDGDIGREISKSRLTGEVGSKRNSLTMLSSSRNKENIRTSPSNNSIRDGSCMRKTETCTHRIDPRANQQMVCNQENGSLSDPHISLDCFIFL
ncbi:hypothetical protein ACHQM5_016511 [Ranunculus cassubicifolius]